jgi:molybdopterin synthase sulfur carrier subunit
MKVKAEFFADLRDKVGMVSEIVIFKGLTVIDLIDAVDGKHDVGFKDYIVQGTRQKDLVKILVNGIDIRALNGLSSPLKEGDIISFFPPIAGG